jgi:four helix bundle protein
MRGRSWIIAPLPIDSLGMKILVRAEELKARTKRFAIRIVRLSQSLPKTNEARVIGNQVLRSGTSIAANYRATCRARSRAEFLAKLGIVVEEADETVFRLELLEETGILGQDCVLELQKEANELLAVFAASQVTARSNNASMKK